MPTEHRVARDPGSSIDDILVAVTSVDGTIVHSNGKFQALTGLGESAVTGRSLRGALTGIASEAELAGMLESGPERPWRGEWRSASGRTIHWNSSAVCGAHGPTLVLFTGLDVSAHRAAGAALAEGEARLAAILEAVVDGIITIDEATTIESVNPAVERLFGWSAGELVGRSVRMLMPEPWRSQHDGYVRHYLETGERRIIGIGREVEGLRKDGSVFPMELAVSEVHLPGRRLFTGIVRDISVRRQAEQQARLRLEELAHASRLADLGELTSSIAHEINQPLAAIVSFAEACLRMLRSGTGSPEVLRGALEQISAQGVRAGDIVHNLRQFVRKGGSSRTQVDVNAVIREVLGLLSHDVRQRSVELRLELDATLPEVPADRVQIGQVTLNLVRNALDAMREDRGAPRCIRVVSSRSGTEVVEVAVSDIGIGLPSDSPQQVFETFFTTKADGMGIGLSICRSLVEAHAGRLTAEANPDGGATFRFTLPIAEAGTDAG